MTSPKPVSHRDNAFDLLRLILAVMVVYTHACLLGGFGKEGFARLCHDQTIAGSLAVIGFFGISGFLVTRSFAVRAELWRFTKARLLRILPGLYFALLVTAFVLAPIIAHTNATAGSWRFADAAHFVGRNALVHVGAWQVGAVTRGLPYDGSINGALWSLFPELCCYGLVAAIGLARWISNGRLHVLVLTASLVLLNSALVVAPETHFLVPTFLQLTHWTPYVTAFAVGALLCCYREHLVPGIGSSITWLIVVAAVLKFGGWALLGPLILPVALIQVALSFKAALPADLSYGTYVLHFPVLQLLAAFGLQRQGFPVFFATGLALTLVLAALSWFAVERPFLRLKA